VTFPVCVFRKPAVDLLSTAFLLNQKGITKMYSLILLSVLSNQPGGILFDRSAGGCAGATSAYASGGCQGSVGLFAGRKHHLFPLFKHRRASGDVGATATASYGCSGGSAGFVQVNAPGVQVGVQTNGAKMPVGVPMAAPPKFPVGTHVKHAVGPGGSFPAGTGVVRQVTPWNTGDGYSYGVQCDKTGKMLPVNFKESELSPIAAESVPAPQTNLAPSAAYRNGTQVAVRRVRR
jgi:hypothetical protein